MSLASAPLGNLPFGWESAALTLTLPQDGLAKGHAQAEGGCGGQGQDGEGGGVVVVAAAAAAVAGVGAAVQQNRGRPIRMCLL